MNTLDGTEHPLVERFFHYVVDGKIQNQGMITAVFDSTYEHGSLVLLQLFSWIDGSPTEMMLVRITDLVRAYADKTPVFNLYQTEDDMKLAYLKKHPNGLRD